jgi:F-type H+-transporting ATPase subunit b
MVPKVMETVAMRDQQIADDLAAAQAARDAADQREEEWRKRELDNHAKAQAVIAKAKADGSAQSEKKVAAAQKRLDKKLAEAEEQIAEARGSAMSEVETVAAEAAQDIVARLAGASVGQAAAKAAVKEAMANG